MHLMCSKIRKKDYEATLWASWGPRTFVSVSLSAAALTPLAPESAWQLALTTHISAVLVSVSTCRRDRLIGPGLLPNTESLMVGQQPRSHPWRSPCPHVQEDSPCCGSSVLSPKCLFNLVTSLHLHCHHHPQSNPKIISYLNRLRGLPVFIVFTTNPLKWSPKNCSLGDSLIHGGGACERLWGRFFKDYLLVGKFDTLLGWYKVRYY